MVSEAVAEASLDEATGASASAATDGEVESGDAAGAAELGRFQPANGVAVLASELASITATGA